MSPTPSLRRAKASPLQRIARAIVLRLILLLDGIIGIRAAYLRARLNALPANHRHRRALEAEQARLARHREVLNHPDNATDARFRGMLAEVARVRNDPGRRALARRRIYPWLFFALPAANTPPRAELEAPEGRCTPITA